MKKFLSVLGIAAVMSLTGCNHVSSIGTIGNTEYMAVRTTDISGPNAVIIVAVDENGSQTVASFGTSGILPSAITAAGVVGAAEVADSDVTNVTGNVSVKQSNSGRRGPLSQP